jgi:hypothetical protein
MRIMIMITYLLSATFFFSPNISSAEENKNDSAVEIVSAYTYIISFDDSQEIYESLCLFGAKYKAAALSAKYLSHKGLLVDYGKNKKEIFCLAANEINATIIQKKLIENGNKFFVKIKTIANSIDFIGAEIQNLELEKKELNFSWQEEMEQHVYKSIDPAQELSRAYRYFRKRYWRIAMIYLDHLENKYPSWSEVYLAKAIGYCATHNRAGMMNALKTSCSLGNREACDNIEGLIQSHDKDIQLYRD